MGGVVGKITGADKQEKAAKRAARQAQLNAQEQERMAKETQRTMLEQQSEQESEIAQRSAMRKKKQAGRTSLLYGSALGVGGGEQATKNTLG